MAGKNKVISFKTLWPLLLPMLLLLPGIAGFQYPVIESTLGHISDLSISHYPNAIFLRDSILQYKQIPLWSPTILSGYPFAANPLSGIWYPPGWLALLIPLPLGFNVVVMLHFLIGGLGMYMFIRQLGSSHQAALFGAIAFESMPKVFAHYGAGHLTMIYAISLTPWLLYAELRRQEGHGSFWLRQPGIVLALIALADPRWAVYAGLFWLAFSLFASEKSWRRLVVGNIWQVLIAFALSSPLLLPLLEYSQLSTRAHLAAADLLAYSFPFGGLLGMIAPQFGGFHEWIIYAGIIVLVLAFVATARTRKKRLDWFWISVFIVSLVFAMGEYIPGTALLTQLPGFSLLRVPARILPIAGFSLVMLAVTAIDSLLSNKLDERSWRRARLGLVAIIGLQTGLALAIWVLENQVPANYVVGLIYSFALLITLFSFAQKRIEPELFWRLLIVLTLMDLGAMDASLFVARDKNAVLAEGGEVAAFLAKQPGQFRVYSPSYSIPQQTAVEYGLELADGVDPLQLQAYSSFMELATGVESNGYSVTLPAFAGDPLSNNQLAKPDTAKLALFNVGFVASEFEMNVEGLEFIDQFDGTFLYRLPETLARALVEGEPENIVTINSWTPNRIKLTAVGPGRLVLSELMYPGWSAQMDGEQVEIETYQGILRSVTFAEGSHVIIFEFHPLSVYVGLGICLCAMVFLVFASRRRK